MEKLEDMLKKRGSMIGHMKEDDTKHLAEIIALRQYKKQCLLKISLNRFNSDRLYPAF